MTTPHVSLQDLRRKIYAKAKAEKTWRFWGLFVHVCKEETLHEAYLLAKKNDGAPGVDGVSFCAIESGGVDGFLRQLRDELVSGQYRPMANRKMEIPKDGGRKVRVLSIPSIRDRVVQGALRLILEPIFEADFQEGSYGYRPGRTAHEAVNRVVDAIRGGGTRVIDLDLRAYFDNVRHHILLGKVAKRINDRDVMRLLKLILKATGSKGVPQGGVISPLLSNVYLNEVDLMLEKAKEVTREGRHEGVDYARFADDLVVLVDSQPRGGRLLAQVTGRLREELANKRTELLGRLRVVFRSLRSQPVGRVITLINPILRGWVNYFSHGNASRCFSHIRDWVEKKVRRHLSRNSTRSGFGWKRWSRAWLYDALGLFSAYRVHRGPRLTALPADYVT